MWIREPDEDRSACLGLWLATSGVRLRVSTCLSVVEDCPFAILFDVTHIVAAPGVFAQVAYECCQLVVPWQLRVTLKLSVTLQLFAMSLILSM